MIKAVIFDMNGVIINDEHIHELAFRKTVKPFGIELDHEGYLECCAGKTDKSGYESIGEKYHKTLPIEELLAQKGDTYLQLFPENKQSYPGVIELIKELSNHFQLGLASSSARREVDQILNEFGLTNIFSHTISGDDVSHGKPDPEPYLMTASKMNIQPNECVVIEDSKSGVISAKAAGAFCIGITTTHPNEDLVLADLTISAFNEIHAEVIKSLVV